MMHSPGSGHLYAICVGMEDMGALVKSGVLFISDLAENQLQQLL